MKRLTTFAVALFATIVSIQAQPITETMNEKAVLQYGNMKIEMEESLKSIKPVIYKTKPST